MADEKKEFPKWVQPDPNVGAVLVRNAAEEKDIVGKLQANIDKGAADREREEIDKRKAEEDATVAEANRIKAERRGQ